MFYVLFPRTIDHETILKLESVSKMMESLERDLEIIQEEVFRSEIENLQKVILSIKNSF